MPDTETPQPSQVATPPLSLVAMNSPMTIVIGMTDTAFNDEGEMEQIAPTCVVRVETINGSNVFAAPIEFWQENARAILTCIDQFQQVDGAALLQIPGGSTNV